jgi:hypothetical protein
MSKSEKELFYEECAKILGVEHTYLVPYAAYKRPNRWNNRAPGNGRFEGRGCVMMFGPKLIHIMLHTPQSINQKVSSKEETFELLRQVMAMSQILENKDKVPAIT